MTALARRPQISREQHPDAEGNSTVMYEKEHTREPRLRRRGSRDSILLVLPVTLIKNVLRDCLGPSARRPCLNMPRFDSRLPGSYSKVRLPGTPLRASRRDRQLAAALHDRGVPLRVVWAAFVLTAVRWAIRGPGAPGWLNDPSRWR